MWNFLSRHMWRDRAEILNSDLQCQSCGKKLARWSDFEVYGLISPERAEGAHVDYNLFKILICKDCYRAYIERKCGRLTNLRLDTCKGSQESPDRVYVRKPGEKLERDDRRDVHNTDEKPSGRFDEIEV